jgi:hypothetical protein
MLWTALGQSVTGTSHRTRNTPCQDASCFRLFGLMKEWLLIVAADGAGSATHSEIGATLACQEFARQVEATDPDTLFSSGPMTGLFSTVRAALFAEGERLNVRPRELACTALLAVVGPTSAAFAQLGDGAIVIGKGQEHRTVFWPEPAEYANATDFLTDDTFRDVMRFETISDPILEVAVFTDGLQRLALDFTARMPFPEFFRPLFHELRTAADPESLAAPFRKFLDSDRVNERTDDDKTLVLAVRCL